MIESKEISLIAISLILLIPLVMALSTLNISLVDKNATAGSINVPVAMKVNNNDSIDLFEFTVQHPSYLILKNVTPTSRMINSTILWDAVNLTYTNVAGFVESSITQGNETILNLVFDVNSSAVSGTYDIKILNPIFLSLNITDELPLNITNSSFTIL